MHFLFGIDSNFIFYTAVKKEKKQQKKKQKKNRKIRKKLQSAPDLPGPDLPCFPIYRASFLSPKFSLKNWKK